MPEMIFQIRWPDGREEDCYSPSLIMQTVLQAERDYALAEFLPLCRSGLLEASDRVKARWGFACSRAMGQLERIEQAGRQFNPNETVTVLGFRF